ncbi:MAG: glycosyltransferase family 39 protein [Myxococcota bacterium]|nr:glycosyltransferase family 39 protein [Myxococcota bacterium]
MAAASAGAAAAKATSERLVLAVLLFVCAGYLAWLGPRDWIPHDDGALAHAAERVVQGEVPHRDFNEPYTGGLTYLHAFAFEAFGTSLLSLRWMLGAFALAFIAALYRIATRFASPWAAGGVTLLAFAWSLPNYFVPLPSWYNLFFATFGTLALFHYIDDKRRRWLVVAGVLGGLSILCKIVGLYYFAAVLLVLVHLETSPSTQAPSQDGASAGRGFRLFVALGLAAFSLVVILLVSNRFTMLSGLLFVVPSLALSLYLGWLAWRPANAGSIRTLFTNGSIVLVSGAAVLVVYASVFAATSSLDALWDGTVSVVLRRLDYTGAPLPGIATALYALPFAGLMAACFSGEPRREPLWLVALLGGLGVVLFVMGGRDVMYQGVWYAVRPLVPILVLAAVVKLRMLDATASRARLFAVAAMTALLSLVQFPFSGGVYFCYAAPFAALLALAIIEVSEHAPRRVAAVVAISLGAFATLWFHTGSTYLLGERYYFVDADMEIELPRGSIRVRERDALFYMELVKRIDRYTAPDDAIYAAPDMPEVYFLGARRNPTRTFFDSTDVDYLDVDARDTRIIDTLQRADIAFAVLGRASEFSRAPSPALQAFLADHLPYEEKMAGYLLRWRDPR